MPGPSGGSLSNGVPRLFSTYRVPLTVTATTVLGVFSYQVYRWYMLRSARSDTACRPPLRAKFPPGELPLGRPISMGGEDHFRAYIGSSKLPVELKSALCRDGVFIGNHENVVALLEKMIADGVDCFQVVADFDATLSRYHRDGKICESSYGILESNDILPSWYREEAGKLLRKYYPIELDPNLSIEMKTPHMKDWSFFGHQLLLKTKLKSSWFTKMVEQSTADLRDRTGELLTKLDQNSVPLLIYSAGMGDLIKEVLKQKCDLESLSQQPMIVANFLKFDDQGVIAGFSDELIHTCNKHEIFPHHLDYFTKHEKRRNALLMGDTLGDLRMADGMRAKENVLTIGFLNLKVQTSFPQFRDNFDIVLIDDQTHDIPIAIVEAIIKAKSS